MFSLFGCMSIASAILRTWHLLIDLKQCTARQWRTWQWRRGTSTGPRISRFSINCQTITLPSLIFLLFISFSACSRMATRKMCQDCFFRLVTMLWRQACPGFVGNFRDKILEQRFFIFPPNDSHVCLLLARLGKDFIGKAAIVEAKSKKVSWTITREHKKLQYNRQVEMFCKIYFGGNSNVP